MQPAGESVKEMNKKQDKKGLQAVLSVSIRKPDGSSENKRLLFDTEKATTEICNYVNTSGFVGRITRSEISAILSNLGATSVDLYNENDMLYGYVYDGFGNKHELSGDALDLDVVNSPNALLTKDTTVFVLEPKNVQITTIPID